MRHQTSRNPGRTQTDLDLERRGTMGDITEADRAAFILVAERLGCHIRAAPAPAPRPGPKPKATPPRQPVMNLVRGGGETSSPAPTLGADPWPAAIGEVVAGAERGMAMPGLRPDDRDRLMEIRTLARLAGRLPARELRAADPERPRV